MKKLEATFREVCRVYFPRWRDSGNWRIVEGMDAPECGAQGKCDEANKIIYINCPPSFTIGDTVQDWEQVIIHEVCHALTSGSHGPPWLRRIGKAASDAERKGFSDLAERLDQEAEDYRKEPVVGRSYIYAEVEEKALEADQEPTFEEMVLYLCREFGLNRKELANYKWLEKVFNTAINNRRRERRMKNEARKRFGLPALPE